MARSLATVIGAPDVTEVAVWAQVQRIPFTITNIDGTTWTTLQTNIAEAKYWKLLRVYFKRTGGTAANYTLRIGEDGASADSDVVYAASAVATSTNDSIDPPIVMQSDSSGRLYLLAGWDAGADNDAAGWVEIEPVLS
jgi:hypothetical protein